MLLSSISYHSQTEPNNNVKSNTTATSDTRHNQTDGLTDGRTCICMSRVAVMDK